jgi:hypothetical protein
MTNSIKATLPNMQAYEDLKGMVRVASVARTYHYALPPTAEQLWDEVQQVVNGVKSQLDLNGELTSEQSQYYCTLDQIQSDLAEELGIATNVAS